MLADKILVKRLLSPGRPSFHLVDEEVTEDFGAVNDDINAGTAEYLKGDELNLVNAAERIQHGDKHQRVRTWAKDSPYILMLLVSHKVKTILSE